MRVRYLLRGPAAICLVTIASLGSIQPANAAQLPLGSLLLRATDLGAGYYTQSSGYSSDRSVILQPGMPVPGQTPTVQQLRQHGFETEFYDMIYSKKVVTDRVVASVENIGDRFTSSAGAHWAFLEVKSLRRYAGLFQKYLPVARVGNESFGVLALGCGDTCKGIVFRQGRYLVLLRVYYIAPPPLRLATLARIVATRIQRQG